MISFIFIETPNRVFNVNINTTVWQEHSTGTTRIPRLRGRRPINPLVPLGLSRLDDYDIQAPNYDTIIMAVERTLCNNSHNIGQIKSWYSRFGVDIAITDLQGKPFPVRRAPRKRAATTTNAHQRCNQPTSVPSSVPAVRNIEIHITNLYTRFNFHNTYLNFSRLDMHKSTNGS